MNKVFKERTFFVLLGFLVVTLVYSQRFKLNKRLEKEHRNDKFWKHKTFGSTQYDAILLGDSRVYRGLSSKSISDGIDKGVSVFNFGYSSAIFDQFYIDKSLKKLSQDGERAILIGFSLHSLTNRENDHLITVEKMNKDDLLIDYLLGENLNVFSSMTFSEFSKVIRGIEVSANKTYLEDYFVEQGWVKSHKEGHPLSKTLKSYEKSFREIPATRNDLSKFVRLACLLKEQGHKVFIFEMPIHDELKKVEESLSEISYKDVDSSLEKKCNLGFLGLNINALSKLHNYDGSHLSGESAISFSREIGRLISPFFDDK